MSVTAPADELLNKAFRLAYFILGERTASIYLAVRAIDKLRIASTTQERRLYYPLSGRVDHPAARVKVNLSRPNLLQRLIYTESELFERMIEVQERPLGQHEMLIRFIKHLVMVTTRHNSFHVALGLCRVLHNYTTAETAQIYNFVIQDPDRGRDDCYYRARKMYLLHEMKGRFGDSLKSFRGYRGEERFRAQEDSGRYLLLVKECLSRFTPWESSCVLPTGIDPVRDVADDLQFKGDDADQEHEVELNRIHTLLHPDCMERLAVTLGIAPPSRRLEVPLFFIPGDDSGPDDDRLNPKPPSGGELGLMRGYLERSVRQRRGASKKLLSVLIDEVEQVCFDVTQTGSVRIDVPEGAEWLEVRSVEAEEEIPLALHPLPLHDGRLAGARPAVVSGEGHMLSFVVQTAGDPAAATAGTTVEVSYVKTGAAGLVSSLVRSLGAWRPDRFGLKHSSRVNSLNFALGFGCLLVTIFTTCLLIYFYSRETTPVPSPPGEQEQFVRHDSRGDEPTLPTPLPQTKARSEFPARPYRRGQKTVPPRGAPQPGPPGFSRTDEGDADLSRSPQQVPTSLLAVKKVYIDPLGKGPLSEQVREALKDQLKSSGHFSVVETRDEADAVFKGTVTRIATGRGGISVNLRLVNAEGNAVWSRKARGPAARYVDQQSAVTRIVSRITTDLLADIQRLEGHQ